jgi:decaprenylphospho-beta-D-erythro-pentofuranosid-2-ulose 2-reductase
VFVLGGSSDIALAAVRRLVADRCRTVVLAARDPGALTGEAERLRALGATTVDCVAFDALDTPSHEGVVADVFDTHDDIDVVVVAFGQLGHEAGLGMAPEDAAAMARVNYVGAVSSTLAVAGRLREQGHGAIVVLSSVAGERVRRSNFVYGSTKAALDAFAQGLGDALVGTGVRVLVVRPGFVRSKMTEGLTPAPMAATPDEVARVIVDGLRRRAEIVWAPPKLRWVFSAFRHLPRWAWRRVSARA